MRTSVTHPLRIDELRIKNLVGAIGLTFCPGEIQKNGWSGAWQRSLDLDLAAVTLKAAKNDKNSVIACVLLVVDFP